MSEKRTIVAPILYNDEKRDVFKDHQAARKLIEEKMASLSEKTRADLKSVLDTWCWPLRPDALRSNQNGFYYSDGMLSFMVEKDQVFAKTDHIEENRKELIKTSEIGLATISAALCFLLVVPSVIRGCTEEPQPACTPQSEQNVAVVGQKIQSKQGMFLEAKKREMTSKSRTED